VAEPNGDAPALDDGIYVDASALAKIYLPEPESDQIDAFLKGRRGLQISELGITEVLSAVARRRREHALTIRQASQIRDALIDDARSGTLQLLQLSPTVHREAERLLLGFDTVPLRTLDALHVALAISGNADWMVTFDQRMAEASLHAGLRVVKI
jgi:predicted nucleic acid-binding protein